MMVILTGVFQRSKSNETLTPTKLVLYSRKAWLSLFTLMASG